MRNIGIGMGVLGLLLGAGCQAPTRMAVKTTEVPRVDLQLEGGNRGYLIGTPPAEPTAMKTTRQMVEATIEIPSFYTPKRLGGQAAPEGISPPETEAPAAGQPGAKAPPQHDDTYVVQKGESLWSIAAKPEIYGKATRWRRIFDANRDILKSPNQVKPGMTLKIPRGKGSGERSTTYGDEGMTYKK